VPDTTQLVAQLLNGTIDVVGPNDLDAGAELEVLFEAADEGALQVFRIPNPTWEHVDMNQNIR
jgi:ABC-type transport system substrate-binding protein